MGGFGIYASLAASPPTSRPSRRTYLSSLALYASSVEEHGDDPAAKPRHCCEGGRAYMSANDAYMSGGKAYVSGNNACVSGNNAYVPGNNAYVPGKDKLEKMMYLCVSEKADVARSDDVLGSSALQKCYLTAKHSSQTRRRKRQRTSKLKDAQARVSNAEKSKASGGLHVMSAERRGLKQASSPMIAREKKRAWDVPLWRI
eukprot:3606643-Rhodomonas_salina.1